MIYYFEIWLRGFAKDKLRALSDMNEESYHPHITLVRPFEVVGDEGKVQKAVTDFCRGKNPIRFYLQGAGSFGKKTHYVPEMGSKELLQFNDDLEEVLKDHVKFVPKLNNEKIFHATLNSSKEGEACPMIEQYMLRLTGIRDKKIWFSYDLVTQQVLSREESLEKSMWYGTVHRFSQKYGMLPTREGYQIFCN